MTLLTIALPLKLLISLFVLTLVHSRYARFSAVGNFHVQGSRTNQQLLLSFQELGQESGTKFLLSYAI